MYESFFGLAKRPFTAMPDPACFVPIEGIYQAYSSLAQCAVDGRGIGVLTAPAGLGKTLVCQRLACELEDRFTVVFLPTGNFLTRRSLLQAILFELGHSYVRMGDQELRLALTSVIRRLRPGRGTIALIVDEAHLLAPRMLEELRTLTNFADAGESLLRVVISGHLSLEETLSQPSLDAFNQRIGIQTTLPSLTRDESAEYVSRRLAFAGANVTDVMTEDALATICEASDGSPRCLNQLCDHSLLLGYLSSQKPVSHQTVREALDDLKQLPLTWNEPVMRRSPLTESRLPSRTEPDHVRNDEDSWIVMPDDPIDSAASHYELESVEFGHAVESSSGDSIEIGEPAAATAAPTKAASIAATAFAPSAAAVRREPVQPIAVAVSVVEEVVDEEVVIDRYAALDAALNRLTRTMLCARAISRRTESIASVSTKPEVVPTAEEEDADSPSFDVVLAEEETSTAEVLVESSRVGNSRVVSSRLDSRSESTVQDAGPSPLSGRRYELLFSQLRRRRIGA
jgi:type II secretory pathway predicted ATPase ExeA